MNIRCRLTWLRLVQREATVRTQNFIHIMETSFKTHRRYSCQNDIHVAVCIAEKKIKLVFPKCKRISKTKNMSTVRIWIYETCFLLNHDMFIWGFRVLQEEITFLIWDMYLTSFLYHILFTSFIIKSRR